MKKLLLGIILLSLSLGTQAQELKYKAAFTFNFIRYIGWSDQQTKGDFVIGVVGKKELAKMLEEQCAGKKFGYQNIVIKDLANVDKIVPCQVLYIGEDIAFEKNYDRILMKGGLKDFLLITETPHGISSGSIINFILEGGSVIKFEISDSNAKKMGISINSKLSTMTSAIKR